MHMIYPFMPILTHSRDQLRIDWWNSGRHNGPECRWCNTPLLSSVAYFSHVVWGRRACCTVVDVQTWPNEDTLYCAGVCHLPRIQHLTRQTYFFIWAVLGSFVRVSTSSLGQFRQSLWQWPAYTKDRSSEWAISSCYRQSIWNHLWTIFRKGN